MEQPTQNRAVKATDTRVALTALNTTKDAKGTLVQRGQSFYAADEATAKRLIAIGRAEKRKPKLSKSNAKQTHKSNDAKKPVSEPTGPAET